MTRTQTALYTWTAPDGTARYLIDPAEWQDGQMWSRSDPALPKAVHPPRDVYGPVWVRELLPIPEPLPEVHWIDGHPVAMLLSLPNGTDYQVSVSGARHRKPGPHSGDFAVIVLSWPDGSKPVPPTVQPKCECYTDPRDHELECPLAVPPTVDGAR